MKGLLISIFGFALALVPMAAAQDKPAVSGLWYLTIESPRGVNNPTAMFKVDGDKLTGTLKGQRGELPIAGTVKGNDIKFSYTIKFQDNDMVITLEGTIDKETIKGKADFGGLAQGDWSGKRHSDTTGQSGSGAAAANVSGEWVFTVETDQGSGSPSFTFKQEGEKLTGTYKGQFGEAALEGTVKGAQITFSFKFSGGGAEGVIVYSGTIADKDSMKGTVKLGDLASGTWTGKRK